MLDFRAQNKANPATNMTSKNSKPFHNSNSNNDATTLSVVAPISSSATPLRNDDDGRVIVFETKSAYSPIVAALIIALPIFFVGWGIAGLVRYKSALEAGINFGIGVFLAFLYPFFTPHSFQVHASNKVLVRNWFGCSPFQFRDCVSAERVSPSVYFQPLCKFAMAFRGLVLLHYRGCCKTVLLSPSDPDGFCSAIERVAVQQQQELNNPSDGDAV